VGDKTRVESPIHEKLPKLHNTVRTRNDCRGFSISLHCIYQNYFHN